MSQAARQQQGRRVCGRAWPWSTAKCRAAPAPRSRVGNHQSAVSFSMRLNRARSPWRIASAYWAGVRTRVVCRFRCRVPAHAVDSPRRAWKKLYAYRGASPNSMPLQVRPAMACNRALSQTSGRPKGPTGAPLLTPYSWQAPRPWLHLDQVVVADHLLRRHPLLAVRHWRPSVLLAQGVARRPRKLRRQAALQRQAVPAKRAGHALCVGT